MGINITSNNAFKKLADKLKAEKNKKLEVGVMIPDVATYAMYLEYVGCKGYQGSKMRIYRGY